MRTGVMRLIVLVVGFLAAEPGIHAQTTPQSETPDLSGIWEGVGGIIRNSETSICGIQGVCAALTGVAREPNPNTAEDPEMLPWAEEHFKAIHEGVSLTGNPPQQRNPSWSGCMPEGPTEIMRRRGFEIRQFSDMVLILYDQDHGVRRIYMDGRGHPANLASTWMGHSIGRYDGDTLVIDTVGIKDKVWVDILGHPHTDALHITERIRRAGLERLEIEITIDDPETYKKPWKMNLVKGLQPPGPVIWDESECEEMLQMGTHFSGETQSEASQEQPVPVVPY